MVGIERAGVGVLPRVFWRRSCASFIPGIESIRRVEEYAAPLLIALTLALFVWAIRAADRVRADVERTERVRGASGARGRIVSLRTSAVVTSTVGFWATLSLNISDFTRYAESQRAQMMGQAIGLPFFMAAFSFVALVVTSCSAVIFGVSDPIALLSRINSGPLITSIAMSGLTVATLSTNIAANIVAFPPTRS